MGLALGLYDPDMGLKNYAQHAHGAEPGAGAEAEVGTNLRSFWVSSARSSPIVMVSGAFLQATGRDSWRAAPTGNPFFFESAILTA